MATRDRLLGSKWTARSPVDRDKHFVVTRLIKGREASNAVESVELEALISRRRRVVSRQELDDEERWQAGWH